MAVDVATLGCRPVTAFQGDDHGGAHWLLQPTADGSALVFLHRRRPFAPLLGQPLEASRLCSVGVHDGAVRELLGKDLDGWIWTADARVPPERCAVIVPGRRTRIVLMNLDGSDRRDISVPDGYRIVEVALSPDGRWIACSRFELDRGVFLLATADGACRPLIAGGGAPAWSPDGRHIAFMEHDHGLGLVEVATGARERLVWMEGPHASEAERRASYATRPVWSPDGSHLWFRLTSTQRCAPDLDFLEQSKQRIAGMPWHAAMSDDQRNQYWRDESERLAWRHSHAVGVVDFARRAVWAEPGYWEHVAWRPPPPGGAASSG